MGELREGAQVAGLESGAGRPSQLLDARQDGVAVPVLGEHPRQQLGRRALGAGEEEEAVLLEGAVHLVGKAERARLHASIAVERVGAHTPERGGVLVLLSDRPAQNVDLDRAGLLGERARLELRRAGGGAQGLHGADRVRA